MNKRRPVKIFTAIGKWFSSVCYFSSITSSEQITPSSNNTYGIKMNKYTFHLFAVIILLLLAAGCSKNDSPVIPSTGDEGNNNTWTVLGNMGVNNSVTTICTDGSGNVYAAGQFTNSSGGHFVLKWDGTTWTNIGLNANNTIRRLCSDQNGRLYAIGDFTDANNNYYIARWDGSNWTNIYNTIRPYAGNFPFTALYVDNGGTMFASNGSLDENDKFYVEMYNGNALVQLGSINANWGIFALTSDISGNLFAAGSFTDQYYYYVAQWNGSGWNNIGLNVDSEIDGLCSNGQGHIFAKGGFTNSSGKFYVAEWDGHSWTDIGLNANDYIVTICFDQENNLYAAGRFTDGSDYTEGLRYVAKWNGSNWTNLGGLYGFNGILCTGNNGKVYAAGFNSDSGIFVAVHN